MLREDSRMTFIYQSTEMQQMFQRRDNQLIILDRAYKTTKHALPLFFLVVKANVNFQVSIVIVLQEESVNMITRALSIVKAWNLRSHQGTYLLLLMKEISSLEIVFPNIQVYLCDFHQEQAWNRWVNKVDSGVANVVD